MLLKDRIESAFRDVSALGSHVFVFVLIVFAYLIGLKLLSLQLLVAIALSYMIISLIRTFYFKDRPVKEKFNSFFSKIDSSSFPSAHSSRGIILLILLSSYFNNIFLTIFLSFCTLVLLYSRLRLKKHFFTDVLVGVLLGVLISLLVLRFIQ
ncbi:MAG: phosphatase PAP2 family protein [Nanoarchaeota archaeon]